MYIFRLIFVAILAKFSVSSNPDEVKEEEDKRKVIIVGAGVSGLAAASRLLEQGLKDITVLEAMDRLGGRIYYKNLENNKGGVDMGAHWVHGQKGNAVYEIAQPLGLLNHSGDFSNVLFYYSDGKIPELGGNKLFELMFSLKSPSEPLTEEDSKKNLEEYIHTKADAVFNELKMDEASKAAIKHHMSKNFCILEACDQLSDVSLKQAGDFENAEGDIFMEWTTEGMNSIINILAGIHEKSPWKSLDVGSKVKLSTKVTKIDWSGEHVEVTTDSGETLSADHVIVTPSLNVLKETHKQIFHPALPQDKVSAIEKLGMDVVDKIYLVFDKPWWPLDVSGFSLISDKVYPTDTQNWEDDIISFTTLHHNPSVLCGWLTGKAAKQMENDTDENVKSAAMKTLRHYLGHTSYSIPDPIQVVRSSWWNNEFVRGSYSFNHKNSDELDDPRGILAKPLTNSNGKNVVLFAGEATSKTHHSSVHGALESGWKQADLILSKKKNIE